MGLKPIRWYARANANLAVAKRENSVITLESDYKSTYQGFDPNKAESYVIFEFMQDKFMKQSVDLATCIQRQYASAGRPNKGVHQAGFWCFAIPRCLRC